MELDVNVLVDVDVSVVVDVMQCRDGRGRALTTTIITRFVDPSENIGEAALPAAATPLLSIFPFYSSSNRRPMAWPGPGALPALTLYDALAEHRWPSVRGIGIRS